MSSPAAGSRGSPRIPRVAGRARGRPGPGRDPEAGSVVRPIGIVASLLSGVGKRHERGAAIALVVGKRAAQRNRSPALTGAGPDHGGARSAVRSPVARWGRGVTAEAVVLSYGL